MKGASPAAGHIVLEASRAEKNYWTDLWRYRELFTILAWRDVSVRYKQTVIGVLWAVIRPLLTAAIFTVVFGRIARLPSDKATPYALMVFAGMLPWSLFSGALLEGSNSLITNANLIGKVYFPRLIIPMATMATAIVDFIIGLVILAGMMVYWNVAPTWRLLMLPAFTLLALLASLGPALWIAAMNVKYRDFRYIIPFAVTIGLYLSPVGFSSALIPPRWQLLYAVNPIVGVIDGYRWSIFGAPLFLPGVALSLAISLFCLWRGIRRFRITERTFADLI
jgi:lipopolysaccharide transport system permease protein